MSPQPTGRPEPAGGRMPADADAVDPRLLSAVVASNKLLARFGPVLAAMPSTRPPAALLVADGEAGGGAAADDWRALLVHLAGRSIQVPLMPVVGRDVRDGTLARHHKVVVVAAADPPDARVLVGLRQFAEAGGLVLLPDDARAEVPGAVRIGASIGTAPLDPPARPAPQGKAPDAARPRGPAALPRAADPLAKALRAKLDAAGVRPDLDADAPTVATARHASGEVEYLLAVNAATADAGSDGPALRAAAVTLAVAADKRPIYDAIHGGPAAAFKPDGDRLTAVVRFGPGQLRAFARTARPIGGVQVPAPTVTTDYRRTDHPTRLTLTAAVTDRDGRILAGAVPLRVRVVDPLGGVRYDLWRATEQGVLRLDLPLAANDPAGAWTITVREMLAGFEGTAPFEYRPPAQAGAVAAAAVVDDDGPAPGAGGRPALERPTTAQVTPASRPARPGEAAIAWRAAVPDRVVSIRADEDRLTVFSHDGSATRLDAAGKTLSQEPAPVLASPQPSEKLPDAVAAHLLAGHKPKRSATAAGLTAVGYWGGTVQVFGPDGTVRSHQVMPSDVSDLVWVQGRLIVGLADGAVMALTPQRRDEDGE